jgi:hypothetical protein
MIPLGPIVRLQVQISSLKNGEGNQRRFDLDGLRSVSSVEIDDGGVWGIANDGSRLADVHHRDHPQSKIRGTLNGISVGFTSHYDAMRERFGDHMTNGVAAESILIDHGQIISESDLANGIYVQDRAGQLLHLVEFAIAEPCAPFSRWSLRYPEDKRPDRTVTETLRFLNNGMRGYYCRYIGETRRVSVGDQAFLAA